MSKIRFVVTFVFFLLSRQSLGHQLNIVQTAAGALKGVELTSRQNRPYYGFLGIPYGKIPERFAVAEPSEPWSGVRDAKDLPPACFQYNAIVRQTYGEEDCLHLNVYSPKPKAGENLPVMFWVFPGGFQLGGASMYDPNYLMDQDVVFVAINYRLGALGFLNTGEGTAAGNMGLKDQVLALKWVQANIDRFGGDPNLVTIFGLSAGAASVDYLTLSPMAKGTFHRAVALSGSSLNPWAYQSEPLELANKFSEHAGCSKSNWEWPQKIKCLQELEPTAIVDAQLKLMTLGIDLDFLHMKFVPSIESEKVSTPRLLEDSPYNLLSQGRIASKVPYLTGFTENEGSFFTTQSNLSVNISDPSLTLDSLVFQNDSSLETCQTSWNRISPFVLYYDGLVPAANRAKIAESIRLNYMGGSSITDSRKEFINIFSDRLFTNGIGKGIQLRAHHHPVYPYVLHYQGLYSLPQFLFGAKEREGTTHADDLMYLFKEAFGSPEILLGTKDGDFSEAFLKLLVSFAKDGQPTALWGQQNEWPSQSNSDTPIQYFKLDEETELLEDPWAHKRAFWESLEIGEHQFQYEKQVPMKEEL